MGRELCARTVLRRARGIRFTDACAPFCCSARHSGQMTPTGICVWHSGQIVRRHL